MMESTDLFDFDNSPAVGEMHRSSIKRSNLEIAASAFGLLAMTDNVLVGVRGFDSNRLRAILTLKGAFGVQNALRFVNFRPLPPESRSWMLTDCFY
jgi:hypothetical protein